MAWVNDFLEKLMPTKRKVGGSDSIVIDIPPDLYYMELALYTASSLISNAISRSEIRTYEENEPVKLEDYYLLNISPNKNETSSIFWHKVINSVIRKGEALVVEVHGELFVAESYVKQTERILYGDIYSGVCVGNLTFERLFYPGDYYLFRLDNQCVKPLLDGMYSQYKSMIASAASSFKRSNGQKYRLKIEGVQAGDEEFNEIFESYIKKQLEEYLKNENAIYPEFAGYELVEDSHSSNKTSDDFIKLKNDVFSTVAHAFHIPDSMMQGNITNMSDVISGFLTFGVDPYADMITEGLNKRAGIQNFIAGNFYQVDTGKINHRDIFAIADGISNLISSGTLCIDEVREEIGRKPLCTDWSRQHYITKNFEKIDAMNVGGGENSE